MRFFFCKENQLTVAQYLLINWLGAGLDNQESFPRWLILNTGLLVLQRDPTLYL